MTATHRLALTVLTPRERGSYRTPTASKITEAFAQPLGGMRLARYD